MAQADAALEAVSALPLLPGEQAQWRECLHHAIGGTPTIVFHSDPALIAGLELRGAHLVVGNNWRADLQRIALVLADEHA
jgi:F-type H+-transporting ATPase subunit b